MVCLSWLVPIETEIAGPGFGPRRPSGCTRPPARTHVFWFRVEKSALPPRFCTKFLPWVGNRRQRANCSAMRHLWASKPAAGVRLPPAWLLACRSAQVWHRSRCGISAVRASVAAAAAVATWLAGSPVKLPLGENNHHVGSIIKDWTVLCCAVRHMMGCCGRLSSDP